MKTFSRVFLLFLLILSFQAEAGAKAGIENSEPGNGAGQDNIEMCSDNLPALSKEIEIKAPLSKVWKAIRARRSSSKQRKLISYKGNLAVIKENFDSIPVIGNASCTYEELEQIHEGRINYEMINSDHFRKFEGCWKLKPGSNSDSTIVSLSVKIDPGVRCPFWRKLVQFSLSKSVSQDLAELERLCK